MKQQFPSFILYLDHWLRDRFPTIWRTHIHWVLLGGGFLLLFSYGLGAGNRLSSAIDLMSLGVQYAYWGWHVLTWAIVICWIGLLQQHKLRVRKVGHLILTAVIYLLGLVLIKSSVWVYHHHYYHNIHQLVSDEVFQADQRALQSYKPYYMEPKPGETKEEVRSDLESILKHYGIRPDSIVLADSYDYNYYLYTIYDDVPWRASYYFEQYDELKERLKPYEKNEAFWDTFRVIQSAKAYNQNEGALYARHFHWDWTDLILYMGVWGIMMWVSIAPRRMTEYGWETKRLQVENIFRKWGIFAKWDLHLAANHPGIWLSKLHKIGLLIGTLSLLCFGGIMLHNLLAPQEDIWTATAQLGRDTQMISWLTVGFLLLLIPFQYRGDFPKQKVWKQTLYISGPAALLLFLALNTWLVSHHRVHRQMESFDKIIRYELKEQHNWILYEDWKKEDMDLFVPYQVGIQKAEVFQLVAQKLGFDRMRVVPIDTSALPFIMRNRWYVKMMQEVPDRRVLEKNPDYQIKTYKDSIAEKVIVTRDSLDRISYGLNYQRFWSNPGSEWLLKRSFAENWCKVELMKGEASYALGNQVKSLDQLMTQRGLDRWGGISSEGQASIWLVFIMLFVGQLLWLRRFMGIKELRTILACSVGVGIVIFALGVTVWVLALTLLTVAWSYNQKVLMDALRAKPHISEYRIRAGIIFLFAPWVGLLVWAFFFGLLRLELAEVGPFAMVMFLIVSFWASYRSLQILQLIRFQPSD
ncbi:MAG: hypothetical protein AAFP89_01480 [Bacteroidota bacterium]